MKLEDSIRNVVVNSLIERVSHSILTNSGINLFVKREDKIHPSISGNKWRKLKYNLIEAEGKTIVTFGGAFSNHIFATAAACKQFGIPSVGIIRGEFDPDNPTLIFAQSCGMKLYFVDRTSYREKENSTAVKEILANIPNYFLIPEGGSNDFAVTGLQELSQEINQTDFDIIIVSAGTGCTASGILESLDPDKELWVFSSLKSDHLRAEILKDLPQEKLSQLKFLSSYHCGGYGKTPENLIQFINQFGTETRIPLDPIYNGKLVKGFFEMVEKNQLDQTKTYLWIHTGGLQGIEAYNYMARKRDRVEIG